MTKSMKKAIALCLFSMGVVGLMAQSNEFKIDVQKTGALSSPDHVRDLF